VLIALLFAHCSGKESTGGGAKGSHGRKRQPVGHFRAVLTRAAARVGEVRALHGLLSAILRVVDPSNPLGPGNKGKPTSRSEPAEGGQ
jgi:hypothetical protein